MTRSALLISSPIVGLLAAGILSGCGGQSNVASTGATPGSQVASSPNGGSTTGDGGAHHTASSFSSQVAKPSTQANPGGGSKSLGGPGPSGNGGAGRGQPTPDGPETNNQADFGAAFSCHPGADTAHSDCGWIEQFGGAVALGRTHTVALTVANASSHPVTIADVTIEGDHADEYTVDPGTCTPGAQVARADSGSDTTPPTTAQTCTLRVTFTPAADGLQGATLVIGADRHDGAMTISLRGTGSPAGTAGASPAG